MDSTTLAATSSLIIDREVEAASSFLRVASRCGVVSATSVTGKCGFITCSLLQSGVLEKNRLKSIFLLMAVVL